MPGKQYGIRFKKGKERWLDLSGTWDAQIRKQMEYLPEKTFAIHIFACVETDAYDERIYHSGKDEDISQLLSHIRDKAVQYREAERGEALIGLSTCADDVGTNGRVVIFGWLEETPAGREV